MTSCERRKRGSIRQTACCPAALASCNRHWKDKKKLRQTFLALGHSEQKVRQQGMEAPGLVVQKLLSDQTELIDLLIAERTRWTRKHRAPGSMRVILRGETCSDSRTLSDGIFTDDVHAHDDKTVCVCVGAFVSCCCSQSQYFYFPAWQILLNADQCMN